MRCTRPIEAFVVGETANGKKKLRFTPPSFSSYFYYPRILVPCGKCPSCLETRRREWCNRISIDLLTRRKATYITLTYNTDSLPWCGYCCRRHIQLFLKRIRNVGRDNGFTLAKIKYFITSEYGAKFRRPHYHGVILGVDMFEPHWCPRIASIRPDGYPVYTSPLLEHAWSKGFVSIDRVTSNSIRYITKYITKCSTDNTLFHLSSYGIGKDYFVRDSSLTPAAEQCAKLGYMVLPSRGNPYKIGVPRYLRRYLDLYSPTLADLVKSRASYYVSHSGFGLSPSLVESAIELQWSRETKKRILDNES